MSSPERFGALHDVEAVSEAAHAIAELVGGLDERDKVDLARLLSHSLATPSRAERREARLGLLVELVSTGTGEVPAVEDYVAERARRAARGETWPVPSVLMTAYGSWVSAVTAAMRVHFRGSASRVHRSHAHARQPSSTYTRVEVLDALRCCAREIGAPPTMTEYTEWMRATRWAAQLAGNGDPRVPGEPQVRRLFGSWERAFALAFDRCAQLA